MTDSQKNEKEKNDRKEKKDNDKDCGKEKENFTEDDEKDIPKQYYIV